MANTSGGPKFSCISEALRYIAFCMGKSGENYMTIARITE